MHDHIIYAFIYKYLSIAKISENFDVKLESQSCKISLHSIRFKTKNRYRPN